jgi:hypothetical protein
LTRLHPYALLCAYVVVSLATGWGVAAALGVESWLVLPFAWLFWGLVIIGIGRLTRRQGK